MSASTSSPYGMLNAYLHETHVVAEKCLATAALANDNPDDTRVAYTGTSATEKKALMGLDKYMANITTVGILRAGKKIQKRKCRTHT
jgi:hypothetical protein